MTHTTHGSLPPDDELIGRLREVYAPPRRDARQRAAFARAVEARVRRRRVWMMGPPLLAATAAAALALWIMTPVQPVVPSPVHGNALLAMALAEGEPAYADDLLPDEYVDMAEALEL